MPCIGKIVAITLLVDCPELSEISAEKVAVKLPNKLKEYYEKLLANGKAKMVALIALARKMLNIACSMAKNKQKWNQTQKTA